MFRTLINFVGFLIVSGISQYIIKRLPRSLVDNAVTSYIDNKIGALIGLSEARVDGFVLEWFIPILLGLAAILIWHRIAIRQYSHASPVDYSGLVDEAFQALPSNEID
jgi:hypothetical protein